MDAGRRRRPGKNQLFPLLQNNRRAAAADRGFGERDEGGGSRAVLWTTPRLLGSEANLSNFAWRAAVKVANEQGTCRGATVSPPTVDVLAFLIVKTSFVARRLLTPSLGQVLNRLCRLHGNIIEMPHSPSTMDTQIRSSHFDHLISTFSGDSRICIASS